MQKSLIFAKIFLILSSYSLLAQTPSDYLSANEAQIEDNDSTSLRIKAEITGFFKNNEYFHPLSKGETLPGVLFVPRLVYQLGNKFRTELGINGLLYAGDTDKWAWYRGLHLRMQYSFTPNTHLITGNLYGGASHGLYDFLYKWQRHYTDQPENGLQFLYKNERLFVDTWLNWKQFIRQNDTFPEKLDWGLSASFRASRSDRYSLSIPLQILISHQGGQIDNSHDKMYVIANIASGVKAGLETGNNILSHFELELIGAGYFDKIPDTELRPYSSGWGIMPAVTLHFLTSLRFYQGYWHGSHFYAPLGEELYTSFADGYPFRQLPVRDVLVSKLYYDVPLVPHLKAGLQAEAFTDLRLKQVDYSMGLYLNFQY